MRRLLITMCSSVLAVTALGSRATADTVEGELVDTHCYAKGGAKGEGHAKCGSACAQSGIPVAVLADGKIMTLTTNPRPLASAVGKTVRVTGTPSAENGVIIPEKVEVKEGEEWKELKMKDVHHKGSADDEKNQEKKEEKKEEKKQ